MRSIEIRQSFQVSISAFGFEISYIKMEPLFGRYFWELWWLYLTSGGNTDSNELSYPCEKEEQVLQY